MTNTTSLIIKPKTQYKKDLKLAKKRGKDIRKLTEIVSLLQAKKPLPVKNKDHPLKGFNGCRDCHIEPDWLLLYKTDAKFLILVRTGSHSDLFS